MMFSLEGMMSYNALAVVFIIGVIFVAQFFVPGAYDWTNNTISELASQGYSGRWIMQLGFIGFGVFLFTTVQQKKIIKVLTLFTNQYLLAA